MSEHKDYIDLRVWHDPDGSVMVYGWAQMTSWDAVATLIRDLEVMKPILAVTSGEIV